VDLPVAHLPELAQERGCSQNNLGSQHNRRRPLHPTSLRTFWNSATSTMDRQAILTGILYDIYKISPLELHPHCTRKNA
jgi:hypothetical protein